MTAAPGRIDVHHHLLPEFYKDVQRAAGIGGTAYQGFPEWTPEHSIRVMDHEGIGAAVVSYTSPGIWFGDIAQTRELARRFNDYLAELIIKYPTRFGAFAFLPLPDVDASLKELERITTELKLDGVCLLTSIDDRYIGHPDFEPLYQELNRRKTVTFIHPCYPPGVEAKGWDLPRMLVDYPGETTKVATNLILKGVTTRCPDIPFILSHSGGTLPMLAHRISIFDKSNTFKDNYPDGAMHHIARFYYDTALSGHKAPLDALRSFVPDTQIMFGTDYPYISEDKVTNERKGFDAYEGLKGTALKAVERDNALRLFPRLR